MIEQALLSQRFFEAGLKVGPRGHALVGMAALVALGAVFVEMPEAQRALWTTAGALAFVAVWGWLSQRLRAAHVSRVKRVVNDFVAGDLVPAFVVDDVGQVITANAAAKTIYPLSGADTVPRMLGVHLSNPEAVFRRMLDAAKRHRAAREAIAIRHGELRVSVQNMLGEMFVWRIERVLTDVTTQSQDQSALPAVNLGRNGTVLYMNDAARALVGRRVKSTQDLLVGQSVQPGTVVDIATEQGPVGRLLAQTDAGVGRKTLYLLPPPEVETAIWPPFHEMPAALLKIDRNGRVTAFNAAARALLGPELSEATDISQLMDGLGRPLQDWLDETLAGRAVQRAEFLKLRRADRDAFVQVALNRVQSGQTPEILAVLTDATELKTLEAQFVQSQKMQAIGQLAGGVAHDFNNLLTAISGHCDLLLLRHDPGDTDYADLQQIYQNANRAAGLVSQLLAFSRKQTLQPEPLDLRDTLADLTHLLNRLVGEKVTLTLSHDPTLEAIRADKRQLEQVLLNLVVNARDAMPTGGQIRIETESLKLSKPLLRDKVTVPEGDYVVLRVSDQGVGIPSDKMNKIFEPFYTTKRTGEGTGLGLSMVYGIVKQSGGFVFVDSQVGSGTSFSLMFPMIDAAVSPAPAPAPAPAEDKPLRGDAVILLVEDEAPVRAFASRALRMRGFTVLEADSGEDALKALEDPSLSVDLFVTDVVMPGRDGPSWVREALKERPDVGVVFVSGYAEDKLGPDSGVIPNSVFLPKPFSLSDLTETVQRQLH